MIREKVARTKEMIDTASVAVMNNGKMRKACAATRMAACTLMMAAMTAMTVSPVCATTEGQNAINGVLSIIYLITMALGILFVIVGFVRLVIAHSQEDAPGQQRASMFIAVGVALLAVKPVLQAIDPASWFDADNAIG